jgi:hypothetical protein
VTEDVGESSTSYAAVVANLYPEAAAWVADHWSPGRLESRSKSPRSSQALCVSLLATLAQREPQRRTTLCVAIAQAGALDLPSTESVTVDAEVRQHRQLLGESGGGTPTALDGLMTSSSAVLTVESKFTEREFGTCGQIKSQPVRQHDARYDPKNPAQRFPNCTGRHGVGSDLKPATRHEHVACRLTIRDGRRQPRHYWDIAPSLFEPDVLATPQVCPFASDNYQLTRNLAFAHDWARLHHLPWYGFLITLVDGTPRAAELRKVVDRFRAMLLPAVQPLVGIVSYQQVADVLHEHGEDTIATWIRDRVRHPNATEVAKGQP